jgi:5-methylcytosine-specific restriction endonuclease McrA
MDRRFYSTREWRRVSRQAIGRDRHRCRAIIRIGDEEFRCPETRGVQVHHVIPPEDGGGALDLANLLTLCSVHHAAAHGRLASLVESRDRRSPRKRRQRANAAAYSPYRADLDLTTADL